MTRITWVAAFLIFGLAGCANPSSDDSPASTPLPSGQWTEQSPTLSPSARILHATAYDTDNNRIILFGGRDASGFLNDTWVYNPSDHAWTLQSAQNPPPLNEPGEPSSLSTPPIMTYDTINQRAILFRASSFEGNIQPETWVYDFDLDAWTRLPSGTSPSPRNQTAMVYDADSQQVILFGGGVEGGLDNETWAFDTSNDVWTQQFPQGSPSSRLGHRMVYDLANQRIILFGGETNLESFTRSHETWVYDVLNNTWTELFPDTSPSARSKHAMTYDSVRNQVLMYGGFSSGSPLPDGETWIYDFSSNQWTQIIAPAPIPLRRFLHSITYSPDTQQAILFGGAVQGCGLDPGCFIDSDFYTGDTWTYTRPE